MILAAVSPSWAFGQGRAAASDQITIDIPREQAPGELRLRLHFRSTIPRRIYSWRGHIYPILGTALRVRVVDANGRLVETRRADDFMPEVPHPRDGVEASSYDYPEALRLKLHSRGNGGTECLIVSLAYDTRAKAFRKAGLTPMHVESNSVRYCR